MTAEVDRQATDLSEEVISDLPLGVLGEQEWDGYERSILQTVSDQVKIGIRRDNVEVTILKRFA